MSFSHSPQIAYNTVKSDQILTLDNNAFTYSCLWLSLW